MAFNAYNNDPKFSDRYAWANSADPVQTAPRGAVSSLIRVYVTVCHSVCIIWTHYSTGEPRSSNFTVSTTNFLGVRIFRKFTVLILTDYQGQIQAKILTSKDLKFLQSCTIFLTAMTFISTATLKRKIYEPPHEKTNKMACVPSEDSDQPGHPPSLTRVFNLRLIGR